MASQQRYFQILFCIVLTLCTGIFRQDRPVAAAAIPQWELPGLRAALQHHELEDLIVAHFAQYDRPLSPPDQALINLIRPLQTSKSHFVDTTSALMNVGADIQAEVPRLWQIIQNPRAGRSARAQAIRILVRTPGSTKYRAGLRQIMLDESVHVMVRSAAAAGLGELGPASLPDLVRLLRDRQQHPLVRSYAAIGLSALGNVAQPYIPDIGNLLQADRQDTWPDNQHSQVVAAQALSHFGASARAYLPEIFKFVQDPDTQPVTFSNEGMAAAFANFGPAAASYVPSLIAILKQPETSGLAVGRAIDILGQWGNIAKPALPILRENLIKNCHGKSAWAIASIDAQYPEARDTTLRCLRQWQQKPLSQVQQINYRGLQDALAEWAQVEGGLHISRIAPLLNIASETNPDEQYRFELYRLSGGRSDTVELLQWVGGAPPLTRKLSRSAAIEALKVIDIAWAVSEDLPLLRSALASSIGQIIVQTRWSILDLWSLQRYADLLYQRKAASASLVSARVTSLWQESVAWIFSLVGIVVLLRLIVRG
jgi:HEAT repeats